jgi:hypothetical protein
VQIDGRFELVDQRFGEADRRMEQVEKGLNRVADGLASVQKTIVFGCVSMLSVVFAGFVALVTHV